MASDDLNEQELQLKKRARRRLVGALALVLLMMIILPLVLDDRKTTTPAEEIAIRIAGQTPDTSNEQQSVTASPEVGKQDEATMVTLSEPMTNPNDAEGFNSKVVPIDEAAATKPSPKSHAKETPEAHKTELKVLAEKKIEEKKLAANKEEAKPAETKKTADQSSEKKSTYMVQIGVFSDAANVKKLEQKLTTVGFKSRTEKIQTDKGEKIRLRTGPFSSKNDAESALARMKDVGLAGMIVTL